MTESKKVSLKYKATRKMDCCYYHKESDTCFYDDGEEFPIPQCKTCKEGYDPDPWDGQTYKEVIMSIFSLFENIISYEEIIAAPEKDRKYLEWIQEKLRETHEIEERIAADKDPPKIKDWFRK